MRSGLRWRFFDFGHHLRVNLGLGLVHLLLWFLWWWRTRCERPHAGRALAINALLAAAILLEIGDFAPLWGVIDGHALWHLSTAPIALLFWKAFVSAELRWQLSVRQSPGTVGSKVGGIKA